VRTGVTAARTVLSVAAALVVLSSCERTQVTSPPPNTVIVRVYRDRKSDFANRLDRKFYDVNSAHHTIASGKWIFIATVEPYHYTEELGGKLAAIKPELIVLDRTSDVALIRDMEVNVRQTTNACDANRICPAFIPSWVSGEELEAAKAVLNAISVTLR